MVKGGLKLQQAISCWPFVDDDGDCDGKNSQIALAAIDLGLDSLCKGIGIGKVADTFRSGSCKEDTDCDAIDGQMYTCNKSRGVCEIKA